MFPLNSEVKLILVGVLLVGAFSLGWEVQGWHRDSQDKKVLEDKLGQATTAIIAANSVNEQSKDQSQKTGEALAAFNTNSAGIKEAIHHANLAAPAAPGCNNPFTPDFVHWLNASPGLAPGAGAGPGQ